MKQLFPEAIQIRADFAEPQRPRLSVAPTPVDHEVGQQQIAEVAAALYPRADELAREIAHTSNREARLSDSVMAHEVCVKMFADNIRSILAAISADVDLDTRPATQAGAHCARNKIALSSAMEACRILFRRLWDVTNEAAMNAAMDGDALHALMVKLRGAEDDSAAAMVSGYRDEHKRLLQSDTSRRALLLDSLLHGRIYDQWSLWEAANLLRLPSDGPYVLIAAEVPNADSEPLPNIESKLRSLDVYSAWRLFPDLQVGIVHVKSDRHLDTVLALVQRTAVKNVGASACFDDLREAPQALHFARITLRGSTDRSAAVSVFDGSILATAAVSAPEVMKKLVTPTLDCFGELPAEQRDVLFQTFRAWLENDASVSAAGEALFCHPNTVRHRLRRIETRTGRSLSRPRDLAELCLAFEVHRQLMYERPAPRAAS